MSFAENSVSVTRGGEKTLAPVTGAESSHLTWTSSDENIVTVDATGKVTGKALGTADITVTFTGTSISATCHVVVTNIAYMPTSGSQDIALSAGESLIIYDDGGADNNYSKYCNGAINLTAPEGYAIKITGTCVAEGDDYDELLINGTQYDYDGWDDDNDCPTVVAIDQTTGNNCIIRFYSDRANNYAGFALTATVVPFLSNIAYTTEKQTDGRYKVDFTFVNKDESAEYTVNEGTDEVETIKNGATTLQLTGVSKGVHTYTFTDGATNVDVVCEVGVYLIPDTGTKEVELTAGETINIYDDGGADNNYSNYCDGTINLTAPEGYAIKITGTCVAEGNNYDELLINGTQYDYDGWDDDNWRPMVVAIDQTTGNNCIIRFYSDGANNYAGFALTATAVPYSPIVKLNSAGYATYSSDVDFVVATEGVKAYTATVNSETNEIVLAAVEDGEYVPASTGVILYGEGKAGNQVGFAAPDDDDDDVTNQDDYSNNLIATTAEDGDLADIAEYSNIWVLGTADQMLKYSGSAFIANRAFLEYEYNTAAAKAMHFVFADETDGINSIENGELEIENAAAYNVAGQRVKTNAKGIVIKNGQKFFNK